MISGHGLLDLALWLAGIGHFCVLGASFQVPTQLKWKEDLAKLTPFNRKLMWVHGAFAVLTIVAFGLLTLGLHSRLLRGDPAAVALSCFIAVYWTARIAVDFLYYSHEDWPKGPYFRIGHFMLTSLFVALAGTNWWVVARYWLGGSR